MATLGVSTCPICHEEYTDTALHFRKCKGAEDSSVVDTTNTTSTTMDTTSETVRTTKTARVKFKWTTNVAGYTYKTITLLSAFPQQSIDLYLIRSSPDSQYLSQEVDVPVGEFDGQLVFGDSYLYPVKKFLIDQDGDVISLDIDMLKMDQYQDNEDDTTAGSSGTYGQYVTAYTPTGSQNDPEVHYNPAYNDTYSTGQGGERRFLMIFSPTTGEDSTMYQPGDVAYLMKNKQGKFQLMHSSHTSDKAHSPSRDVPPPLTDVPPPLTDDPPPLTDEFSQQLSKEGFTPATVKSKKSSSATTNYSRHAHQDPIESVSTHPQVTSSAVVSTTTTAKQPTTTATTTTTTTTSSSNERFSVSQIKEQKSTSHVTMEEYTRVCQERDRMKSDHNRITAQLERKVKRLEKSLNRTTEMGSSTVDDDEVAELQEELEELKRECRLKDTELAEANDRMTALENQIEEYAGTIEDQSKVIHKYVHHGGGGGCQHHQYAKLYTKVTDFTKKQQLEFRITIDDMEKRMKGFLKSQELTVTLHETCDKLASDIKEYRQQTKQLIQDMKEKDIEIISLREKLQRRLSDERQGQTAEMDALEMETLRQKCEGWRASAERSLEEVEVLRIQVQQLEQERDSLNQELKGLADRLQSSLSNKDKSSDLRKQVQELQDIRINMEVEMSELRREKTEILERNATLVNDCDPNVILKVRGELEQLREEKVLLEDELKSTGVLLESHQKTNLDLKNQLEKTSNPQVLTQIEEKMSRYKQERDSARRQLASLQEEIATYNEEINAWKKIVEELKVKKRRYRESCKGYEQVNEELKRQIQQKDETIEFFYSIHGNEVQEDLDGDVVVDQYVNSDEEMGVSGIDSSLHEGRGSTQSLPVATAQQNKRKSKSGIILTSKSNSAPRSSYSSIIETMPTKSKEERPTTSTAAAVSSSSQYQTSSYDSIRPVQVRTKHGLREAYVVKLDQDALQLDMKVIVKRKEGVYEGGVVKYFGHPVSNEGLIIGVKLDMQRSDGSGDKPHDGSYKNNVKYFSCPKGYGLYPRLSNLYIEVIVE